jgi:hypothetical protein
MGSIELRDARALQATTELAVFRSSKLRSGAVRVDASKLFPEASTNPSVISLSLAVRKSGEWK